MSHVFTKIENRNVWSIPGQTLRVNVRRLDSFDLGIGPFVIKIDVEGQEMSVLKSANRLFKEKQVKAVYLDGYENKGIPDFLRQEGFRLFEGRSLLPVMDENVFSLLAIHETFSSSAFDVR